MIAFVLLPVPGTSGFDYLVPEGMEVEPGFWVEVPFGKRVLLGVVQEIRDLPEYPGKPKPILRVHGPALPPRLFPLFSLVSEEACTALGMALAHIVPKPAARRHSAPFLPFRYTEEPKRVELTEEQKAAVAAICDGIGKGEKFLLFGPFVSGGSDDNPARSLHERGDHALEKPFAVVRSGMSPEGEVHHRRLSQKLRGFEYELDPVHYAVFIKVRFHHHEIRAGSDSGESRGFAAGGDPRDMGAVAQGIGRWRKADADIALELPLAIDAAIAALAGLIPPEIRKPSGSSRLVPIKKEAGARQETIAGAIQSESRMEDVHAGIHKSHEHPLACGAGRAIPKGGRAHLRNGIVQKGLHGPSGPDPQHIRPLRKGVNLGKGEESGGQISHAGPKPREVRDAVRQFHENADGPV